ncbi:MAG: hypothetical protein LBV59_05850 [Sphingobacterium sp.]|jgi:hypothetical protein|uniref:hypothetical protein n=1 Tax=Sphingobacterium sp. TaxID=341027 RepID=UPI002844000B|nr:hypothetical protein [Sphingobacterium sp.]MDR3007437.1 hypothetical protein [Sphingobacterium sp.]
MILDINKLSEADIRQFPGIEVISVSIEGGITRVKLDQVARLIKENDAIKLVLVAEQSAELKEGQISDLNILDGVPHLRHLAILAFGDKRLETLKGVEHLKNLISFSLQGFYKKDIDLRLLQNADAIERLELEFGISGERQLDFVNTLSNLKELKVSTIDLSEMRLNRHLKTLKVNNTLKHPELLPMVFPGLKSLIIHFAKGLTSFDFLSSIPSLENLTIGDTKKLFSLPQLENAYKITSLTLSNVSNFNNWTSIFQLSNLVELNILGPSKISKEEVLKFESLPNLKHVKVSSLGIG